MFGIVENVPHLEVQILLEHSVNKDGTAVSYGLGYKFEEVSMGGGLK